jgi:hypothetical protein
MSGTTMTQTELLYAFSGSSTALATFTAEDNLLKTYPLIKLPDMGQLLGNLGEHSSSMKIRALGKASAASATTPTYTFTLRLINAATFSSTTSAQTNLVLATSTAATTVSGVTNGIWQLDVDLVLRSLHTGGAPTFTVTCGGLVAGSAFSASTNSLPAAGTAPTATLDVTQQYYMFLSAACSASSASNSINTELFKVYGEN